MKSFNYFLIALCCFLLISAAPRIASGQERASSPQQPAGEVELLRHQIDEQKVRMQQLQSDLHQQSQVLEKQQRLLEALLLRMEQRDSVPHGATVLQASTSAPVQVTADVADTRESVDQTQPAPAEKKVDDSPESVEAGHGKIKFNGLLQAWYAAGNGGFHDTFRLRRLELKFTGQILPHVGWTVMVEPSRGLSLNNSTTTIDGTQVVRDSSVNQGSRMLQDAFITLSYFKRMNVDFGQLKIPLSLEGTQGSGGLDTVERALFISDGSRGGGLADVRDLGVMLYGPLSSSVDYQIGLFNGSGETQNDVARADQKSVIGRLVVHPPFLKGLQIGGSGVWGNGDRADRPRRDRLGAEMLFVRGPVTVKGELMTAKDGFLNRRGYYGHFGYRFNPKFEGVFRVDWWDPDTGLETSAANVTERDYVTGLNYYIKENHFKLQFNYLRKTFDNSIVASRNLVLVNLQTSW